MQSNTSARSECAAYALALLTAADACVDGVKLRRLDELDAFGSIGVSRARFLEFAIGCRDEIGESLVGQSWLPASQMAHIDRILDAVGDSPSRLLVCGLAAAAMEADGCIDDTERLLFEYTLARWHVPETLVTTSGITTPSGGQAPAAASASLASSSSDS
jgi:hypothetical protein